MAIKNSVLAIYLDDTNPMGYPFDVPEYIESYATFCQLLRDRNVTPYIVRGGEQYLGNMQFKSGWILNPDQTLIAVATPITANLIYRKGHNLVTEPTAKIVNQPDLEILCHDKLVTFEKLAAYMPMCLPVDVTNWQTQIVKIPSDKIVVKPVLGTEGRGIIVCSKAEFNYNQLDPNWEPYLVQEFVDTSAGIPGLVSGKHDLRLYIFNGATKMAEIREPKAGSYLANIAQGGTLFQVPLDKIPAEAYAFAKDIDEHFKTFWPRIYTVDMMFGPGMKPYLVELNSQPGLPYKEWESLDHYYTKLHSYLLETLLSGL